MAAVRIRQEETFGLTLAVLAHLGLLLFLVMRPAAPPLMPEPERISVTLSDDMARTSTSPQPMAKPAPDGAPEPGEPSAQPPPPLPSPLPRAEIAPQPRFSPPPPVAIRPRTAPAPLPAPRPTPTVPARVPVKPAPKAVPGPATAPAAPMAKPSARPVTRPVTRPGASRIGSDFLRGLPGAQAGGAACNPPAAVIGPAVQSALAGAISRQLKPRWAAPQGVDAEKLVTVLAWNLNRDGTLAGRPTVVRQDGINDANRPQAQRHAEQAIRAVQLAAPFTLPPELYDAWKRVAQFRFDRRLSQ